MASDSFTTPGSSTWTAPVGVTVVQAQVWAAGGGGGDDGGGFGGGGAGGGAYSIVASYGVIPGNDYTVVVGAKGTAGTGGGSGTDGGYSLFVSELVCYALGGSKGVGGGSGGAGGAGGLASGGVGDTKYSGGTGANATINGGGGGSSAGTGANGANGSATTGGTAPAGGGNGGNENTAGSAPGGGGGGAGSGGAGGAGGDGKVVLTYTAASPDNAGFRSPIIGQKIGEAPFPGAVIVLKNPYGDPPASFAAGPQLQKRIETPSPPPFGGQVVSVRPAMGETPPIPGGVPTRTYRPVPGEFTPFPGAVLTALRAPFGIPSLPPRPRKAETANPEPFGGQVLANRPTAQPVTEKTVQGGIFRPEEPPPTIAQPAFWGGTHERPSVNPLPVVIRHAEPPLYAGGVVSVRPGFGLPANLPPRSVIARVDPPSGEPGRVLVNAEIAAPAPSPIVLPRLVRIPDAVREIVQPRSWVGVPQRDAAYRTVAIVQKVEEAPFPGRVQFLSNPFGTFSIPSRPVVVKQTEGLAGAVEPGRVRFGSKTPTDPVQLPRIAVVREVPGYASATEPGRVFFTGGHAAPTVVAPLPIIVAGDTRYPEVSQPFFGWGWRTGTGEPSGVPPGNPVALIGLDNSAVSITSEDCECR